MNKKYNGISSQQIYLLFTNTLWNFKCLLLYKARRYQAFHPRYGVLSNIAVSFDNLISKTWKKQLNKIALLWFAKHNFNIPYVFSPTGLACTTEVLRISSAWFPNFTICKIYSVIKKEISYQLF